jgi:hypothetical protein
MVAMSHQPPPWGSFEMALAAAVTTVWAIALLGGFGTANERLLVQAAMMTVLGAVFGRRAFRKDEP